MKKKILIWVSLKSEKYDKFTLFEDSLYIEVKEIDDYTNLERDIDEFVLIKSNENKIVNM